MQHTDPTPATPVTSPAESPPIAVARPVRQPWVRPRVRRLELQATEFGGALTEDGDGLGSFVA